MHLSAELGTNGGDSPDSSQVWPICTCDLFEREREQRGHTRSFIRALGSLTRQSSMCYRVTVSAMPCEAIINP